MFWFMGKSNFTTKNDLIADLIKFPELRILDRFDIVIPFFLAVGLFIFGDILVSGEFNSIDPLLVGLILLIVGVKAGNL